MITFLSKLGKLLLELFPLLCHTFKQKVLGESTGNRLMLMVLGKLNSRLEILFSLLILVTVSMPLLKVNRTFFFSVHHLEFAWE